ncbi:virulence factor TspB C-terminal domain-related protein [Burkholderia pseudomallei]|uniref:virulence factor TspB C-terminal domain-related protein n=1 Tax=Burkholderia pseudomallei TaxID=28450 RepID=UPI0022873CD3|nr:virulence factor TspB C-terminal domain-related protein [Burkholderia pseudomallei]
MRRESKSVSLAPISIGLTNGVCPHLYEVEVFGAPLRFDYAPICELAVKLRPLVLLLGALLAGLIFVTGLTV